jgi:hypothetical protein
MNQFFNQQPLKIFVLAPNEDWIVDRLVNEWNEFSHTTQVASPRDADIVWLLADWSWRNLLNQISYHDLLNKTVVTTVHHIVPEKFGDQERQDFAVRDRITNFYHVYNQRTFDFISQFTIKPIRLIPYWANDSFWIRQNNVEDARKIVGIPQEKYVIGSFQRDTEGFDLISPKLEKGPDLFCDFVRDLSLKRSDIHVLLGGWRRQYIINRLKKANIPYTYFERPSLDFVKRLYESIDLYVVSSRHEGGPQSLIECGLMGVPCISRPVGIAEQVLKSESINDDLFKCTPKIPDCEKLKISNMMPQYVEYFREILKK